MMLSHVFNVALLRIAFLRVNQIRNLEIQSEVRLEVLRVASLH